MVHLGAGLVTVCFFIFPNFHLLKHLLLLTFLLTFPELYFKFLRFTTRQNFADEGERLRVEAEALMIEAKVHLYHFLCAAFVSNISKSLMISFICSVTRHTHNVMCVYFHVMVLRGTRCVTVVLTTVSFRIFIFFDQFNLSFHWK